MQSAADREYVSSTIYIQSVYNNGTKSRIIETQYTDSRFRFRDVLNAKTRNTPPLYTPLTTNSLKVSCLQEEREQGDHTVFMFGRPHDMLHEM